MIQQAYCFQEFRPESTQWCFSIVFRIKIAYANVTRLIPNRSYLTGNILVQRLAERRHLMQKCYRRKVVQKDLKCNSEKVEQQKMRKLYYVYDSSIARNFSKCFVIVSVDTGRSSRPPQVCYCAVFVWAYPLADCRLRAHIEGLQNQYNVKLRMQVFVYCRFPL